MTDELDLFRQQLQGVAPIKQDRHLSHPSPTQPSDAQLARRASACAQLDEIEDGLSDTLPAQLKPDDLISYKKSGIQEGVFKKLRLGKYPIGDRIDLHQLRLEQARIQILRFIHQSQLNGHRCVLIIHGKGAKSNPPARMKSYVCHWLPQLEDVLAVHTAQPMHGGYGAIYVLLRKSLERKIDNQERHARHLG
ncbi:DNA endonuclease SmrA [Celerinatantimonas sp. MCCC 1A17872]|uniref:DNA endonuclease SmrA n=1 Tax=Celerinatantimonas sp. MCCC 1A17872 TaxID=3177514 RepID=UPI0038BE62BC